MTDYKGMYIIMIDAADKAVDALANFPCAKAVRDLLCDAMLRAEERYIQTAPEDPEATFAEGDASKEKAPVNNIIQLFPRHR